MHTHLGREDDCWRSPTDLYLGLAGVDVDQRILTLFYVLSMCSTLEKEHLAIWRRIGDDSLQLERNSLYGIYGLPFKIRS